MSRLPTALTSSMLPGFTLTGWLPGSTTFSGCASVAVAGVSPPTGVVPGAGLLAGVSPPTGEVPGSGCALGVVVFVLLPVCEDCCAGPAEAVSPPKGVVPGAG
jgi:hypothetical protein